MSRAVGTSREFWCVKFEMTPKQKSQVHGGETSLGGDGTGPGARAQEPSVCRQHVSPWE